MSQTEIRLRLIQAKQAILEALEAISFHIMVVCCLHESLEKNVPSYQRQDLTVERKLYHVLVSLVFIIIILW